MKKVIVFYDAKGGMQQFEFQDVETVEAVGSFIRVVQASGQSYIPEHLIKAVTVEEQT